MVSLAHGTNDAQKTMGIITLALIANGTLAAEREGAALGHRGLCRRHRPGTYIGGWRVIRTLGKGLVEIEPPQGMAAESSSAAIILLSSHFGYSLSTTHVATGSILGCGLGKRGAEVRWNVAGRMATAWVVTLPGRGDHGRDRLFYREFRRRNCRDHRRPRHLDCGVRRHLLAVQGHKSRRGQCQLQWTGSAAPSEKAAARRRAA